MLVRITVFCVTEIKPAVTLAKFTKAEMLYNFIVDKLIENFPHLQNEHNPCYSFLYI